MPLTTLFVSTQLWNIADSVIAGVLVNAVQLTVHSRQTLEGLFKKSLNVCAQDLKDKKKQQLRDILKSQEAVDRIQSFRQTGDPVPAEFFIDLFAEVIGKHHAEDLVPTLFQQLRIHLSKNEILCREIQLLYLETLLTIARTSQTNFSEQHAVMITVVKDILDSHKILVKGFQYLCRMSQTQHSAMDQQFDWIFNEIHQLKTTLAPSADLTGIPGYAGTGYSDVSAVTTAEIPGVLTDYLNDLITGYANHDAVENDYYIDLHGCIGLENWRKLEDLEKQNDKLEKRLGWDEKAKSEVEENKQWITSNRIPVSTHIQAWIQTTFLTRDLSGNKLAILGEYGTGKSLFCRKLAAALAEEYLLNGTGPFPILLKLQDARDAHVTVLEFILAELQKRGFAWLRHLRDLERMLDNVNQTPLLLILDGYDELTGIKPDLSARYQWIKPLLNRKVAVLLTSRTHPFDGDKAMQDHLEKGDCDKLAAFSGQLTMVFNLFVLAGFDELDIQGYLQQRIGKDWQEALDVIRRVHNLRDLARRPVLLDMIAESYPALRKTDETRPITAGDLYEYYTERWIKRDHDKGILHMTPAEIWPILEGIALDLHNHPGAVILVTDFPRYLNKHAPDLTQLVIRRNPRECLTELRNCAFMNFDAGDTFHFIHQSFEEYFAGRAMAGDLKQHRTDRLGKTRLSPEAAEFAVDAMKNHRGIVDDAAALRCQDVIENPTETDPVLLRNALMIRDGMLRRYPGVKAELEKRFDAAVGTARSHQKACNQQYGQPPSGMQWIPPGRFLMGSYEQQEEEPVHWVEIPRPFLLSETTVTQQLWEQVMGSNPSEFKDPSRPVETVTWFDCIVFLNRLSVRDGLRPCYYRDKKYTKVFKGRSPVKTGTVVWDVQANGYRLPIEAEWEYACRAGTTTQFSTGDNLTTDQANYDGGYPYRDYPEGQARVETVPVQCFKSNAWGLFDMHGNVFEWCWDWYGDYPLESVADPAGPSEGSHRVVRGGSWNGDAGWCRSAYRGRGVPGIRSDRFGFRFSRGHLAIQQDKSRTNQ